jgi:hypothetical protein
MQIHACAALRDDADLYAGFAELPGGNAAGLYFGRLGVRAGKAGSGEGAAYKYSSLHDGSLLEKAL